MTMTAVTKFVAEAIVVPGPRSPTLYLDIKGVPQVQERPRIRMQTFARQATLYDPSSKCKIAFKLAVKAALTEVGIATFPLFSRYTKIKVVATCYIQNLAKDVDNLLKFVQDALESVVYTNDCMIFESCIKKVHIGRADQFTKLEIFEVGPYLI